MTAANIPRAHRFLRPEKRKTSVDSISIQPVPPTPTTTTVVQESSEPEVGRMTPERFAARLRRLDVVAAGLVLVFAFSWARSRPIIVISGSTWRAAASLRTASTTSA